VVKVWFRRDRHGRILCLVKFDNIESYIEINLIYFWRRNNKKVRLTAYNITHYYSYWKDIDKFPKEYKLSYGKGLYMEGDVIYNHEVIREAFKKFGVKVKKMH
jgi:hypothetical protein